ncbi:MAG: CBS domain-containing protein, partial [bacterium]
MRTVEQLLEAKKPGTWSVLPDDSVFSAIQLMADKSIGAVLVVENDKLAGIMSERDYARKVILKNRSSKDTPVRNIMTSKLICITPEHTIDECMALMSEKKIRHLPVLQDKKLVGIISIGDVVKSIISEREYTI